MQKASAAKVAIASLAVSGGALLCTAQAGAAGGYPPPVVTPTTVTGVAPVATSTGSAQSATSTSGQLAFTGADIAASAVGGLVLVAAGTLLVVFTRKRDTSHRSTS